MELAIIVLFYLEEQWHLGVIDKNNIPKNNKNKGKYEPRVITTKL
jgi:hypothetical protein